MVVQLQTSFNQRPLPTPSEFCAAGAILEIELVMEPNQCRRMRRWSSSESTKIRQGSLPQFQAMHQHLFFFCWHQKQTSALGGCPGRPDQKKTARGRAWSCRDLPNLAVFGAPRDLKHEDYWVVEANRPHGVHLQNPCQCGGG